MSQTTNAAHGVSTPAATPLATWLAVTSIVVGLVLIFGGIGLLSLGRGSVLASLMTCVGFGIVLAAFGATAGGSWVGWRVTGAGALAIVLFLVLQHYQPAPSPLLYKKGQLRGDLGKIADLRIIDELPMYQYRDRTTSSIRFVLLERKLKSARLSIQIDSTESGPGKEFFELFAHAPTIQAKYLAQGLDTDLQIQWMFDYDRRVVRDGAEIIFSEQNTLQENLLPVAKSNLSHAPAAKGWMTQAMAGTLPPEEARSAVSHLLRLLKSDDASLRRNAREELVLLGPPGIAAMASALRENSSDYRLKLGIVFALSEILRRTPHHRFAISAALTDPDFSVLAAAASDNDKTLRFHAAEFLYLLQDPRAVAASVTEARKASDADKAKNQLLILKGSGQSLNASQRSQVLDDLTNPPGVNNDIVRNVGGVSKTLGWQP